MNITDTAHKTVRDYPGGSESLAPRLGMSAAVLRSKVNSNITTHHLTLAEADEMMSITGDHRILQELANQHGYTLQRIGDEGQGGSVLGEFLKANSLEGEFARTLQDALADDLITDNEMRAVVAAGNAYQAAFVKLLARVRVVAKGPTP